MKVEKRQGTHEARKNGSSPIYKKHDVAFPRLFPILRHE